MLSLDWEQVKAWRLSQHHLIERAEAGQSLEVVARICGLHAQLMTSAELSLWARVDGISPADVRESLWHKRKMVKTWAMRGTLHLVASSDYPLYVAALSLHAHYRKESWLKYHGLTTAEFEKIVEGICEILSDEGMTRDELAEAISRRTRKPRFSELLRSGWGTLLKPAAFQGQLCFGPSQGQKVTFVRPDKWVGRWKPVDSEEALKEILRRYLTTYGPATASDFARWWGLQLPRAKRALKSIEDEIEAVDVEGREAWALNSTLKEMAKIKASRSIRLLPHFDPYVIGASRGCEQILADAHRPRVYRKAAWISPVVLVNGRMEGVWGYDKRRSHIEVKVEMFSPPSASIRRGIEEEAHRLGRFLGAEASVVY